MNVRIKLKDTLEIIKKNEDIYLNLVKDGSKDPMDYHNMAYYSGMHNGFALVFHALENKLSEREYDENVLQVLQNTGRAN